MAEFGSRPARNARRPGYEARSSRLLRGVPVWSGPSRSPRDLDCYGASRRAWRGPASRRLGPHLSAVAASRPGNSNSQNPHRWPPRLWGSGSWSPLGWKVLRLALGPRRARHFPLERLPFRRCSFRRERIPPKPNDPEHKNHRAGRDLGGF